MLEESYRTMLTHHSLPALCISSLLLFTACEDGGNQPEAIANAATPSTETPENEQNLASEAEGIDNETERTEVDNETPEEVPVEVESPVEVETPDGPVFMPLAEGQDVVEFVEVDRYMGLWYEIATTPSFQQASCLGTTAEYTFNEEQGWVDVSNLCYVGNFDGTPQGVQGRAELVDLDTQAKLNVIFFGQAAPYWVVALDGNDSDAPYAWAVVSVPGKQTLWILSRTPQMADSDRAAIEAHLALRGYPVDKLLDTPQPE